MAASAPVQAASAPGPSLEVAGYYQDVRVTTDPARPVAGQRVWFLLHAHEPNGPSIAGGIRAFGDGTSPPTISSCCAASDGPTPPAAHDLDLPYERVEHVADHFAHTYATPGRYTVDIGIGPSECTDVAPDGIDRATTVRYSFEVQAA